MEIEKLKVAELRTELTHRGLDTKGTKPILVARLKEAIQKEESSSSKVSEPVSREEASESNGTGSSEAEAEAPAPDAMEEDEEEEMPEGGSSSSAAEPEESKEEEETPAEEAKGESATTPSKGSNRQQRRGVKRKLNEDEPFVVTEDEPEYDEELCLLDWANSDLHLLIDKECLTKAEPLYRDGWGYVWAGAKGTKGLATYGKMAFQVKLLDNCDSKLEDEKDLHELRLGFSTDEPSMALGETKHSYSYGGSGKKGTDSVFEDYGETFTKDDIMGAYLDMSSDEVKITFTKNETTLETAFTFPKAELEGKALFPHVSTRNIRFEVNFGKSKDGTAVEPMVPLLPGYDFPSNLAETANGPPRIPSREECEMIMMIGLPASGKSTWAKKHVEENPDKRYYVIGTMSLIEKMKVNGVCRRTSHTGRKDVLIQKCTRCLQDWLRIASTRRRNIIIDQTNVYPNAQKRKVRPFEGMNRKAVVVVPSEEEYKARAEAQEKAENKDVPDSAVMEMKANFSLPAEGGVTITTKNAEGVEETKETKSPFKEIIFPYLNREEAQALVDEYNKDAKEKGYGKKLESKAKRARGNNFRRGRVLMRGRRGGRGFPPVRGGAFRGMPNGRRFMRGMRRGMPPPPMRGGFMPPPPPPHRGMAPFNRGRSPGGKFGKRPNWGGPEPAWSQWQQPSRPSGWGHWNQGGGGNNNNNQGSNQNWGGPRGGHQKSFNQRNQQQGFSSGGNNSWNSSSNWGGGDQQQHQHHNQQQQQHGQSSGWGGGNHQHSNNNNGWDNNSGNSWNQNNQGGGGGQKWPQQQHNNASSNHGYPGNSYWGGSGGGYGGR